MSYPSGQGGYGDAGHGQSSQGYGYGYGYGAVPGQGQGKGLPFFLNIGVVALGVIGFFLGFAPYLEVSGTTQFGNQTYSVGGASANFFETNGLVSTSLLLAAALVAAIAMLPKQEGHYAVITSLSATGFISLLFQLFSLPEGANMGLGLILVLITSFLQAAVAIAALLFSADIIKAPQPSQPQYGYYGQSGGYGQLPQQQSQPQQPYYGGGAPGSSPGYQQQQQQPPSQPPQQQNPW